MNAIFWQIVIGVVTIGAGSVAQVWIIRWAKRDSVPDEIRKEIDQLREILTGVRGKVMYLEGRINGKNWKREEV